MPASLFSNPRSDDTKTPSKVTTRDQTISERQMQALWEIGGVDPSDEVEVVGSGRIVRFEEAVQHIEREKSAGRFVKIVKNRHDDSRMKDTLPWLEFPFTWEILVFVIVVLWIRRESWKNLVKGGIHTTHEERHEKVVEHNNSEKETTGILAQSGSSFDIKEGPNDLQSRPWSSETQSFELSQASFPVPSLNERSMSSQLASVDDDVQELVGICTKAKASLEAKGIHLKDEHILNYALQRQGRNDFIRTKSFFESRRILWEDHNHQIDRSTRELHHQQSMEALLRDKDWYTKLNSGLEKCRLSIERTFFREAVLLVASKSTMPIFYTLRETHYNLSSSLTVVWTWVYVDLCSASEHPANWLLPSCAGLSRLVLESLRFPTDFLFCGLLVLFRIVSAATFISGLLVLKRFLPNGSSPFIFTLSTLSAITALQPSLLMVILTRLTALLFTALVGYLAAYYVYRRSLLSVRNQVVEPTSHCVDAVLLSLVRITELYTISSLLALLTLITF